MSLPLSAGRNGCPKCSHFETEIGSVATTGGGSSKTFDIQNRQFTVISCVDCSYSEFYHGQSSGNFIDLFPG